MPTGETDPYEASKKAVLGGLYSSTHDGGIGFSRDSAEALGIDHEEFVRHVLDSLVVDGLVRRIGKPWATERGFEFRLTPEGLLSAEGLRVVDPQRQATLITARVALLRHLKASRDAGGPLADSAPSLLLNDGHEAWAIEWAIDAISHLGYSNRHPVTGRPLITDLGAEWLGRYEEQQALVEELVRIESLRPNLRGTELEKLLKRALAFQGLHAVHNTGGEGEQIDVVADQTDAYFVGEAKWEQDPVEPKVVDQMVGRLTRRPSFYSGVIFSMSGFTDNAYKAATRGAGHRVIHLLDGQDVMAMIRGDVRFMDLIVAQRRQLAGEGCLLPPSRN